MYVQPNKMLPPTSRVIKPYMCSMIAVEGPNIIGKLDLSGVEIPYESQYRSRIVLKANAENVPLIYGFIGNAVTFIMIKVTYDNENDPYYEYEQEKYNITYNFEDYGDYWLDRKNLDFEYALSGDSLNIVLNTEVNPAEDLSLIVENGTMLNKVFVELLYTALLNC